MKVFFALVCAIIGGVLLFCFPLGVIAIVVGFIIFIYLVGD